MRILRSVFEKRMDSKWFANRLSKRQFGIKLCVLFVTFKINRYFQLKSNTLHALRSNVVHQFTCSCDANLSYIDMSTRHSGKRAGEHLNLDDSHKSAIKDHLRSCHQCCNRI